MAKSKVSTMYLYLQEYATRLIVLFGLVFTPLIYAQDYGVAPVPGWVEQVQTPASDQVAQENHQNGVAYLLVDRQWRVNEGQQSHYRHIVSKTLNTSGVEEASQISIDFDPVYESVVLHEIVVHRDGRSTERIGRSRINLIQREKDLDSQIYDGSKTLNVFIEDVRSGDIVEYSYTIEGENPVFSGHFSKRLKMRWGVPVGRAYYRVLWSSSRALHIRNRGTDIKPVKGTFGQYTEYVWQQENVEELLSDDDIPDWYNPFPVVYLSDFTSWSEVADWAWPLYQPVVSTPAQNAVIAPIMETAITPEQRVLAALRFVQDDVRYLGIEIGVRSHKPNAPDAVIEQRFGDCKDKSRLLVSLLKGMDIEASSALVNTSIGERMKKMLPTPTVFDHAIVVAQVNGKNYWLDPTRNYQSGDLNTMYQPDYDYALVVTDHGSDLVKMSDDITAVHSKVVEETFDIRNVIDKPATYRILTSHEQYYADSLREDISETSVKQMQQSYLNYLAYYYSDIQVADRIKIADDESLNRLTITEQYSIPEIWTASNNERYLIADFEPFLIDDYVNAVEAPIRTMPYAVTHPVRYQHTTRILVPEGMDFDDELIKVEDKAFQFTKKVEFSDDVLLIDYVYESLSDHVQPEDIQTYSGNIRRVQKLTGYRVRMTNPAIDSGQYSFDTSDVNWQMVIIVLLASIGATIASLKYIYLYDPPYRAPDQVNTRLEGFAGWLLLAGLVVILSPIRMAVESQDFWYVFSALQWSMLENELGVGLLFTVVAELIFNVVQMVMVLFLVVMFFNRRHTFPRFFIAYMMFALAVLGADLLILHLLSYPGVEVTRTDIGELVQLVISTAIWSLYFVKSERVKATFTRQRKREKSIACAIDTEDDVNLQQAG